MAIKAETYRGKEINNQIKHTCEERKSKWLLWDLNGIICVKPFTKLQIIGKCKELLLSCLILVSSPSPQLEANTPNSLFSMRVIQQIKMILM